MAINQTNDEERSFFDRISYEAEQGRLMGGEILVGATGIAAGSQVAGTQHKITEPVNRKERAQYNESVRVGEEHMLCEWASDKNVFINAAAFIKEYGDRKIGEGAEQQVYLAHTGRSVLKTNDAIMHGTWLEFFDRLALHNWLFPETGYSLSGFTMIKDRLAAIIEQPFIRGSRGASRSEVEEDLGLRGFTRLRNDDYYSPSLGILLEDLHDENVLVTEGPLYLYFDPIVYLETPEMNLAGKRLYRFPFT